jgi:hypothetical protein
VGCLETSKVEVVCLRLDDLWVDQIHSDHTLEEECLACRGINWKVFIREESKFSKAAS